MRSFCVEYLKRGFVVAVLVPRPNADGVDVYASGTHDAVEQFVWLVTAP